MPAPKCRDCGAEDVVWGRTPAGKPILMDKYPAPPYHLRTCPSRRKGAKAEVRERVPSDIEQQDAVAALVSLGYKVREAQRMVRDGGPGGDVAEIVARALRGVG